MLYGSCTCFKIIMIKARVIILDILTDKIFCTWTTSFRSSSMAWNSDVQTNITFSKWQRRRDAGDGPLEYVPAMCLSTGHHKRGAGHAGEHEKGRHPLSNFTLVIELPLYDIPLAIPFNSVKTKSSGPKQARRGLRAQRGSALLPFPLHWPTFSPRYFQGS